MTLASQGAVSASPRTTEEANHRIAELLEIPVGWVTWMQEAGTRASAELEPEAGG